MDRAGHKGTGKWSSQNALDLGVPIPTIDAAVQARLLSALKEERVSASEVLTGLEGTFTGRSNDLLMDVQAGLRLSEAEQRRRELLDSYVRFEPLFPWTDSRGVEALVLLVKRSKRLFAA